MMQANNLLFCQRKTGEPRDFLFREFLEDFGVFRERAQDDAPRAASCEAKRIP